MKLFCSGSATGLLLFGTCLLTMPVSGEDVHQYYVQRGEYFTQVTTNRATTALTHQLFSRVYPTVTLPATVLSGSLAVPQIATFNLINRFKYYELLDENENFLLLSGPAPRGLYSFSIQTLNQGTQNYRITMPGPAMGIPPPRVANLPEAQSVDWSQPFTLTWDRLMKRGARDYLALSIVNPAGTTVFAISSMDMAATNAVIPEGTLQPNTTYWGYLFIIHYFGFNDNGIRLPPYWQTMEARSTKFQIQTLNPIGVLNFSSSPAVASEDDATGAVTVERTQGGEGRVTVDYFSSDGSAHSNANYVAVAGTLTFEPGVTTQTITVPLVNDGLASPPRTFQLTLANPTGGATLAPRPRATMTILDSQSDPGTNVNSFEIAKVQFYSQNTEQPPTQGDRSISSRFFASVHPSFPGAVTNATIQLPNGITRPLTNWLDNVEFNEDFPSRISLNRAFPGGKYVFRFDTVTDGSFSAPLLLGAERSFPAAHLINWVQSQTIDAGADFTFQWKPFTGSTTNDAVVVVIQDAANETVLSTPKALEAGALPGSSRALTIPANTLARGQTYSLDIDFVKVASRKLNTGGPPGYITFYHRTTVRIRTIP